VGIRSSAAAWKRKGHSLISLSSKGPLTLPELKKEVGLMRKKKIGLSRYLVKKGGKKVKELFSSSLLSNHSKKIERWGNWHRRIFLKERGKKKGKFFIKKGTTSIRK